MVDRIKSVEFKKFVKEIDAWIKEIQKEVNELAVMKLLVSENLENITHNYELIYELKDQIEELKQEINALKLIQIISLKKGKEHKIK